MKLINYNKEDQIYKYFLLMIKKLTKKNNKTE